MSATGRFSQSVVAAIDKSTILGIRAGIRPHRFLGVWAVVVDGRVFVRSWNDKRQGWRRAFLEEPRGTIQIPYLPHRSATLVSGRAKAGGREIPVRARKTRGERLLEAIDIAYKEKYNTPGSRKYVIGLAQPRRRATTTELVPRST